MKPRVVNGSLVLLLLAQGCSAGQHAYVPSAASGNVQSLRGSVRPPSSQLFVINAATGGGRGSVSIYDLRTARLIRTLTDGIQNPVSVASDSRGDLYVADAPATGSGSIAVFPAGSSTAGSSITNGIDRPSDVKIDDAGELIVANKGNNTIAYYSAGGASPIRTIGQYVRSPIHIGFDPYFADLWVLNAASITDYTPGQGALANPIKRVRLVQPTTMQIGPNMNLFVADRLAGADYGSIQIVSLWTDRPAGEILQGIHTPADLVFDHTGNLYVANDYSPGSVTVYAKGSNTLRRKITAGVSHPDALATADNGWLFVANNSSGHAGVTAYPPGKSSPAFRLTAGITSPVALRIREGPSTAPAAVIFPISGDPSAIALGPDGNIWFVESGTLTTIDQSGNVRSLTFPKGYSAAPYQRTITRGSDGALWFEAYAPGSNSSSVTIGIGRIMPDGTGFEFFAIPYTTGYAYIYGMTMGPDGAVWFTLHSETNYIERITTAGEVTAFRVPRNWAAGQIVTGPDGALWFTEPSADRIARMDTTGHFTQFHLYGTNTEPSGIVVGPDGALWSIETRAGRMVRITTSGKITTGPEDFGGEGVAPLVIGSDEGIWFLNGLGVSSGSTKTFKSTHDIYLTTVSSGEDGGVAADSAGNVWFTVSSPNEVVRVTP